MKKTLIAIPRMDSVPTQFRQALAMLQKEGEVALTMQVGSLVYNARNNLAKTAAEMGVDYVFWLDSDMVFAPNTLSRMTKTLEDNDLDFLTGVYFRRVPPFSPVLYSKMSDDGMDYAEVTDLPTEGLFEVAACGFGCVLMKTDVIIDTYAKTGEMFTPIGGTGEDISFCIRARQCGYKIMADPSIVLGHVGHAVFTRDYWEALKNNK